MSRYRCARCDWRAPNEPGAEPVTLLEHEAASGHPTCGMCGHSLRVSELVTCDECVASAHTVLQDITTGCRQLRAQLGYPPTQVYDRGPRGDDLTLPGGRILPLISPGSMGTAPRRLTPSEAAKGETGREHGADNVPTDPTSIAFELGKWEDDWRQTRGEEPASGPPTVRGAASYLMANTTWASREHPAFADYVHELHQLHGEIRAALGADDRPLRADVRCLDCDTRLERASAPPQPCQQQHAHDAVHCDQGGYADTWACPRCRRAYAGKDYLLAVRAQLDDNARPTRERHIPAKASELDPDVVLDHRSGHAIQDTA